MEPDIRLEDYLDDKLQSTADLESLDSLIANIELQRSQLQAQLEDATQTLEDVRQSALDRQGRLAKQIDDFEKLQQSIDVRLQIVVASDAPDEAMRRLETPMQQLHKVGLAYQYVSLLQDVENMRLAAKSHLPQSPKAALQPYTRLRKLSKRLRELQGPADDAAGHLVTYVEQVTASVWDEMKKIMAGEMGAILEKRKWPQGVDAHAEMDDEWIQCFEKLADLQIPEVLYSESVVTLLPIDVMARPFVQWFRFQFMGDNATSAHPAFGTFCIPNFVSLIDKWEEFFRENLGHVLASRFQGTKAGDKAVYMDPAGALITSMLPVMREKVDIVARHGLKHPQYLSSLMIQLMNFDDTIRTRFNYDGGDPENGWAGLASEVLDKHFREWLRAEKDFALQRYQTIMSAPDAHSIDYDYSGPGKMKPTFGAVRVTDLLRSVTTQYERIRRLPHKVRFLIDIQQEILDQYHTRLLNSLEAYSSLISPAARMLQGVTKEQLAALEGTGAFETLCKVQGSSDHIVNTLKDWGNEEFFIILWEELKDRAKQADDQTNLVGGMSYDHVRDHTSSDIGSDGDGTIFDETIKFYSKRRDSARAFLVAALIESNQTAFRPYLSRPQWSLVNNNGGIVDPSQLGVTAELVEPLRVMKQNLKFFASALSTAVYRRTWREGLESLQETLWSQVLIRQNFTTLGAAQFVRDLQEISELVDGYISGISVTLTQLQEGARLLSLPVEAEIGDMTLQQASDRVFTDNTEARKLLEELGIVTLEPANARRILQRRVEYSE
ncbi:TIP-1 family-domain-containing protein [Pseudomassariella vexata]|uniref:TIP-1 family-domain-containing protein n=1 Tax=Pseudomassariella vexata TaxID=1141098 RepID=A0A1Y2E6N9_9PEZI|nr:TIP-1 family-domain-containing protein [Pseudomassariella vexata]ORY67230.1 TIP-1 family-domain-containing protein [Pseudomassariella vexata]